MQAMVEAATGTDVPAGRRTWPSWRERFPLTAQIGRYMLVGTAATALNAVLFYTLRTWWEPVAATLVPLVLSTAFSTEAHRRYTFEAPAVRGWRVLLQSVGTVAFYASYSAVVLVVLHVLVAEPTPLHETLAIATASVLGGVSRFLLLRYWVFVPASALPIRTWGGTVTAMAGIPRTTVRRSALAVVAGAALLLSSAGACGDGGDGDDEDGGAPGVTQQDDDGDDD